MKIKTHRMTSSDWDDKECEICGQKLTSYWTQACTGHKPQTRCVFHCQRHRSDARQIVESELAQGPFLYTVEWSG